MQRNREYNREYNRMGKTRDLFKKIRDTKGTFHAKMGLIKDRNGMDLTEAEDVKKTLFWGAPKSLQMVTAAMELEDAYSLEEKL